MEDFSFFLFLKKDNKALKGTVHIKHLVVFFCMKFKLLISFFIAHLAFTNVIADQGNSDISFYTGTFDVLDKEGDDQTSMIGIEHRNTELFRNTFLGKLAPITGAFITGKDSVYFYTGVEGQYSIGPMNISPSFTPGYYEKGSGKDLGSALEFKSEIKVGFDILKDSKLGYSYSHISNNDWGSKNPGTDNQQIIFQTKF